MHAPVLPTKKSGIFNAKLKESFPDQYLDCYDYLEQNGFSTVDDLHYTNDTYRAIHDYTVSAISEMENPQAS